MVEFMNSGISVLNKEYKIYIYTIGSAMIRSIAIKTEWNAIKREKLKNFTKRISNGKKVVITSIGNHISGQGFPIKFPFKF